MSLMALTSMKTIISNAEVKLNALQNAYGQELKTAFDKGGVNAVKIVISANEGIMKVMDTLRSVIKLPENTLTVLNAMNTTKKANRDGYCVVKVDVWAIMRAGLIQTVNFGDPRKRTYNMHRLTPKGKAFLDYNL